MLLRVCCVVHFEHLSVSVPKPSFIYYMPMKENWNGVFIRSNSDK